MIGSGMNRLWKPLLLTLVSMAALAACSAPRTVIVQESVRVGDRQREWALVYFLSWRKEHDGRYLDLSRKHMAEAVKSYFEIQVIIGHSYPDFYDIDKRRLQSCDFLRRIDNDADRYGVPLASRARTGCFN